jgi:ribonuclease HI
MSDLIIYTDGACFGNPGPMGIGIVIYRDGFRVEELSESLGIGTNNQAEYTAIIRAIETAHELGATTIHLKSDSELVVRQLNNQYKINDPELRQLKKKIDSLVASIKITFEHIPREKNSEADKLSKEGATRSSKKL